MRCRSLPAGPLHLEFAPPRLALGAASGAANAEGAAAPHAATKGVVGHHCAGSRRLLRPKSKGGLLGTKRRLLRCTKGGLLRGACRQRSGAAGEQLGVQSGVPASAVTHAWTLADMPPQAARMHATLRTERWLAAEPERRLGCRRRWLTAKAESRLGGRCCGLATKRESWLRGWRCRLAAKAKRRLRGGRCRLAAKAKRRLGSGCGAKRKPAGAAAKGGGGGGCPKLEARGRGRCSAVVVHHVCIARSSSC